MICTRIDNWLRNHMEQHAIWIAQLSDGTTVYQDDDHPDFRHEKPGWLRLKDYVQENNLKVTALRIKFRDNAQHVEDDAIGYYFSRGVRGNASGYNKFFYAIGVVRQKPNGDYKLFVTKWMTPELIPFNDGEVEERGRLDIKGDALIVNEKIQISE